MGTKYSSQATSGYNSSPPVDDGTASEANKVKWSSIKTKLADVLKTFGEAINTALVTALDTSARSVAASDSAAASDHWRTIQVTTPSVTITLADATTMAAGYIVEVANQSTGSITVALATATDTIDTVTNTTHTIDAYETRRYLVNTAATGYITTARSHPRFVLSTPLATTSGETKDFTIPSWAKRVTMMFNGVSTDGTELLIAQLGDAGGVETAGYSGQTGDLDGAAGGAMTTWSSGVVVSTTAAATQDLEGSVTFTLMDATNNIWSVAVNTSYGGVVRVNLGSGTMALDSALTTVRLTSTNTPDTFDAGSVNVLIE